MRYVWKLKCDMEENAVCKNFKSVDTSSVIKQAIESVSEVWEIAVADRKIIPLKSKRAMESQLTRVYEKGVGLNRNSNKVGKESGKIETFRKEMGTLFDVCSCKCVQISCEAAKCNVAGCDEVHISCKCEVKVPKRELKFLFDQRKERKMCIGGVDERVTSMWKRSNEREKRESEKLAKKQREEEKHEEEMKEAQVEFNESYVDEGVVDEVEEMEETEEMETDRNYEPPAACRKMGSTSQNRRKLPNTAKACDRYLVSNRAGAAIANGVLEDYGIITEADQSQVIGPTKLKDERHRYRMSIRDREKEGKNNITSIYFDGKKTATRSLVRNEKTGKWSPKLEIEDHYVILEEPGSEYLTHVTPVTGHGDVIAKAIYDFLETESWQDQPIYVVGGDGTNTNVGAENGAIHYLEMMLGHAVHYAICQLHGNELPFRALFYFYDGKPTGPASWTGPIGQQIINNVSSLPITKFKSIPFDQFPDIPDEVVKDLSWDQKYLYRIIQSIICGEVPDDLAAIEPGPPCTSRWNTLWERICRLYVSTEKPSKELKRLTNIIVKLSGPMWFTIKCNPKFIDGPRNTYKTLQFLKNLTPQEKSVAKKAIQRNAYFAHPDQLLLAMCADEDIAIRQKAVLMIQKIRVAGQDTEPLEEQDISDYETDEDCEVDTELIDLAEDDEYPEEQESSDSVMELDMTVREVRVPKLKFSCQSYHTMINWKQELVSEPPYIASLSDEEISSILTHPLQVPKWPNHTQAVERAVKAVTEASAAVSGFEERDGFIRQRIQSRKEMPSFETKANYKPSKEKNV